MMIRTLLVGAVVGVVLAIGGVAAAMATLHTSADEVATKMTEEAVASGGAGTAAQNPLEPPEFYGSR